MLMIGLLAELIPLQGNERDSYSVAETDDWRAAS